MTRLACLLVLVFASTTFAQGIRIEKRGAGVAAEPGKTAYLGVRVASLDQEARAAFKIPAAVTKGVVIAECMEDAPALRAGLRAGDVVTKFNGQSVGSPEELIAAVRKSPPGARVTYVVRRGTGTIAGTLTLGERGPDAAAPQVTPPKPRDLDQRLDTVQGDIEKLRQRLLEAKRRTRPEPRKVPRTLEDWLEREELAMVAARKAGNREKVRFHSARMSILREMKAAGAEAPAQRLDRIERKVNAILETLEELEEELDEDEDDDDEDEDDD
jgi:membrane-associated protease RseP (regulator of RpoE activity)